MNPQRLKTRLKFIEGTPLKDRARTKSLTRREIKNINQDLVADPNDKFDTFFDYEEELAEMQSSSEQFAQMEELNESLEEDELVYKNPIETNDQSVQSFLVMEEVELFIMEEAPPEQPIQVVENTNKKDMKKESKFNFIQCDFIKDDGNRCKRQAPKNGTTCSVHRKLLKKRGL
jgi:hypothetical protein